MKVTLVLDIPNSDFSDVTRLLQLLEFISTKQLQLPKGIKAICIPYLEKVKVNLLSEKKTYPKVTLQEAQSALTQLNNEVIAIKLK